MFAKRRSGFTLIEILVVISIIAILTAILLPVFVSARHRGRMTACASNLHQISLALQQYAADNSGCEPKFAARPALQLCPVWTLLAPYTHSMEVFHCPEAQGEYEAVGGYDYRGASSVFAYAGDGMTSLPPQRQPRRGSGTVVAVCTAHTRHLDPNTWAMEGRHFIGPLIVVREDGSASQIQADRVEQWACHNGQWWRLPENYPLVEPQVGDLRNARYPGEEWPPLD